VFPQKITPQDHASGATDYGQLFQAYYPNVYRQLNYLLADHTAAEDLAQETFLRLYRSPPADPANIGGWLARVAANLAYNYLRSEKRRRSREMREYPHNNSGTLVSFDDMIHQNQDILAVRRCLARLGPRERMILLLKFAGYSYQEIAQVIGVQASSVGNLLARAQRKFKEEYERHEGREY